MHCNRAATQQLPGLVGPFLACEWCLRPNATIHSAEPNPDLKWTFQINHVSTSPAWDCCYSAYEHTLVVAGKSLSGVLRTSEGAVGPGLQTLGLARLVEIPAAVQLIVPLVGCARSTLPGPLLSLRFLSMSKHHLLSPLGTSDTKETTDSLYKLGLLKRSERPKSSVRAASHQEVPARRPSKTI
jgi:hypothetical protein